MPRRSLLSVSADNPHMLVQAPVRALDEDGLVVFGLGTAVFAVVLVVLWVQDEALRAAGNGWWLWTAVAGLGLGLVGAGYSWSRRVSRTVPGRP